MRTVLHHVALTTALLATLTVLAAASPACSGAASFSVALPSAPIAGPALADGRALWVERRGGADVLVSSSDGVAPHDLLTIPAAPRGRPVSLVLTASGDRAALWRDVFTCRAETDRCGRVAVSELWLADLTAGTVAAADSCLGEMSCSACVRQLSHYREPLLRDGTLSLESPCEEKSRAWDLATGQVWSFDGTVFATGGRYAIVADPQETELAEGASLVDMTTGHRIVELTTLAPDPPGRTYAVDADGTVAHDDGRGIALRAPDGHVRHVAEGARPEEGDGALGADVGLTGGLVLQRRTRFLNDGTEAAFTVSRRDGSSRRVVQAGRTEGLWDFAARHLAWTTAPCVRTTLQVWDLAGAPPAAPSSTCPLVRVARGAHVTYRRGHLRVPVSCPASATPGCTAYLSLRIGRAGISFVHPVRLPAGTRRIEAVRAEHAARLEGRRSVAAVVDVEPLASASESQDARAIRVVVGRATS